MILSQRRAIVADEPDEEENRQVPGASAGRTPFLRKGAFVMSRTVLRSLSALAVLLSLSLPLGAQPAAQEPARVPSAFAVFWEKVAIPLLSIFSGETTDGRSACDPNGGPCATTDGRSICDPNGGNCYEI
jgi:hypothetical protein